jgi:membrane-associated phospholipid phosphatase
MFLKDTYCAFIITYLCGMPILGISFWQQMVQWDKRAFILLNDEWTNPFFNAIMPFLRSPVCWAPVYIFILAFAALNYRLKGGWWIIMLLCTVALTDMTGTYGFKHVFQRTRPCGDPDLVFQVNFLLERCSTGFSFISNHAANHFGIAMFIVVTFGPVYRKWTWIAFAWASLVCYAQIYVGLHFPLDVIVGALVGLCWGYLMGFAFNKRFGFTIFGHQPVV